LAEGRLRADLKAVAILRVRALKTRMAPRPGDLAAVDLAEDSAVVVDLVEDSAARSMIRKCMN
jgi:hypothetical protein